MRRVSWLSVLAVLLALAGCLLAAYLRDWAVLAICITGAGGVSGMLSLREGR